MRTSTAEAHDYICPRCGGRLALDRAGRGFVRHLDSRNCSLESGLKDVDDSRLTPWHRYSGVALSQAMCIGAGEFVPATLDDEALDGSEVVVEPRGERFVLVRINSPHDALVDVRRRAGVVEELRLRPADTGPQEPVGWIAQGDVLFDSAVVVGDAFEGAERHLDVVDVRPGRYVIETSSIVGSPHLALRARWWKEG